MESDRFIAEMEADFDDIAKDLRASAAELLGEQAPGWEFQRRQGLIAEESYRVTLPHAPA